MISLTFNNVSETLRFSMCDVNVKPTKTVAAAVLLLLLPMVAVGNAGPLMRTCGENQFYDDVAQICTNCDDICDPRRGTPYLCDQHADECRTRQYIYDSHNNFPRCFLFHNMN